MTRDEFVQRVRDIKSDPLGQLCFFECQTQNGTLRWNGGMIQWRRNGEVYFGWGITAEEFLKALEPDR